MGLNSRQKVSECASKISILDPQRPLQTTIELKFTDSGVVVLISATRNAKSKLKSSIDRANSYNKVNARARVQVTAFVGAARSLIARLRNLGFRSCEFIIRKLITSTFIGKSGAIHLQIITKPATNPSSLTHCTPGLQSCKTGIILAVFRISNCAFFRRRPKPLERKAIYRTRKKSRREREVEPKIQRSYI